MLLPAFSSAYQLVTAAGELLAVVEYSIALSLHCTRGGRFTVCVCVCVRRVASAPNGQMYTIYTVYVGAVLSVLPAVALRTEMCLRCIVRGPAVQRRLV